MLGIRAGSSTLQISIGWQYNKCPFDEHFSNKSTNQVMFFIFDTKILKLKADNYFMIIFWT